MDWLNIHKYLVTFILLLYGEPHFPRNLVDKVMQFIDDLYHKLSRSLENDILDVVEKTSDKTECIEKIRECFRQHGKIFTNVLKENDRFNVLKAKGFQMPEEFEVGKIFVERPVGNKTVFVEESIFGMQIPLRHSLKQFMQIPGLFKKIVQYTHDLSKNNGIVSNLMQAKYWLNKFNQKLENEYLFPLFLYYDEIEVGNPLGSHAGVNKFGVVYASVGCLPTNIASRLTSIIFSTIIKAEDKKKSSNSSVFKELIKELKFLQTTGIVINVDNNPVHIKFQLALVLGDNLGLNQICGFSESFKANAFCRICQATAEECSELCVEDKSMIRNPVNYAEDLKNKDPPKTAIKDECIFHQIDNFHVTENRSVDFMHDVLEGVCVYVIRAVLYHFIFVKKYLTLEILNQQIENFEYSPEDSNKPPPIIKNRLKEKLNIKYSAAEMLCLTRYLGVMIGEFIPHEEEHWKTFLLLQKIVDILMSPRLVRNHIENLKLLIRDMNESYRKFYGPLKPKFHFLTHYPTILYLFGPCVQFWAMRYESRHRDVKASAQSTSSRRNLLKTIAIKQVLKMCEAFDSLEHENDIIFKSIRKDKFVDHESYNMVVIDGIEYKIGSFLVTSLKESEVEFGKITNITKEIEIEDAQVESKKRKSKTCVRFMLEIYEEIYFDEHTHAYVIERSSDKEREVCAADIPVYHQ